jgi:hypothetical protein
MFLNKNLCEETVKQLDLLNESYWMEHGFHNPRTNKTKKVSGNKELSIAYANHISTKNDIMKKLWKSIDTYVKNLNFKWYTGWQGYTDIRFNKYSKSKKMAKHCDHIHSMFDGERKGIPTLSVLGILNDDYNEYIKILEHIKGILNGIENIKENIKEEKKNEYYRNLYDKVCIELVNKIDKYDKESINISSKYAED